MGSYYKTRYSTEARFRKYVKGYGFLSFAKKCCNKYGKKLMDTATKTGIDASKRVVQKTTETTGDLIGNKIADKITSITLKLTQKKRKKQKKKKKFTFHQKKENKLLMTWDFIDVLSINFISFV